MGKRFEPARRASLDRGWPMGCTRLVPPATPSPSHMGPRIDISGRGDVLADAGPPAAGVSRSSPTGPSAGSLLRQPGGFEGLVRVGEPLPTNDLAISTGVQLCVTLIHVQPALAPPPFSDEEHHLLAPGVDDSLDLDGPVVPLVRPAPEVVHDRLMAASNVAVRKVGPIPFNVWVIERRGGLNTPRLPRIPHPPYRLHVLLRHRPRSISRWKGTGNNRWQQTAGDGRPSRPPSRLIAAFGSKRQQA